ncbi:hypothetical protein SAMN05443633_107144 [Chryseobacterium arachidis]|uniref:Uncharacterized protein n=1 Tax=Chryseobacterium arachidis TaxID=1416778 RepID=A0A1M5F3E9_9FLAO|nr:hypothetical protein [Chryseobacterium arachidis]SHF85711.1 hypothetical protein SAMN05443633_107144 [Chryseobacterium arachidis]
MSIPLNTIYSYFETGDFPTQEQFQASWSSFWHKDESIPTNKIAGLDNLLQNKADKNIFETHVSNPDSHANYLAKKDASNLNNDNIQAWKSALGVGELPENIATVDDANNIGNVYTKSQSDSKYMFSEDFLNDEGEILAERIEALGLTNLIEAVETNIVDFATNNSAYTFEDNDFIAIPVNGENYSLYMFKGGEKTDKNNYLPTGISNVTIGMVEGLQASLNNKVDKPTSDGKFYIKRESGVTTTELLANETLATVVNRNNYSPKGIAFLEETNGTGIPGANGVLGANKTTYSFFFGNMNAAHTGVYNIAIGYSSLPSVTSGQINSVIGHYAGKDLTTGGANTIMGYESGTGVTTGNDNTLIGVSAGYNLKGGTGNSMLGKWTGCFIAGSNNTFLGYQAGQYWGSGGSGLWSSNIVIGGGTSGHPNGIWGENNLIIGSNIELIGAQSNKFIINNFLAKDNNFYKTHFIEGNFADRWLRFDTSLQVLRLPVADASFTKNVVAKPDGTFGLENKVDYIPLSGTTAGKPVTGEIEFSTEGGGAIKSGVAKISVADGYTTILSGDPVGERAEVLVSPLQVSLSQGLNKHINLTQWLDSIDVGAPSEGPGMVGQYYHGDHYVDNSFVQKRWVEEKLQDSGRNYKIYRALLKGIRGTFEPLFVELENTLGDIQWSRAGVGQFVGNLQGAFQGDKVWINSKINTTLNGVYPDCHAARATDDSVYVNVFDMDSKSPLDFETEIGIIEIYIYN